jgi:hypothetical protein
MHINTVVDKLRLADVYEPANDSYKETSLGINELCL